MWIIFLNTLGSNVFFFKCDTHSIHSRHILAHLLRQIEDDWWQITSWSNGRRATATVDVVKLKRSKTIRQQPEIENEDDREMILRAVVHFRQKFDLPLAQI